MLNGLFDIDNRLDYLTENGDMLPHLKGLVPWEKFRRDLEVIYDHDRKSNAGRRPFDVVMMFKILILQSLYNLSDDEMEYQIMDRLSFMRFLTAVFPMRRQSGSSVRNWRNTSSRGSYLTSSMRFLPSQDLLRRRGKLSMQRMRPASPMVRRKRDFLEWEFTKKMNAVGL